MANETPNVIQTESLINPPDTATGAKAQPAQSATVAGVRKTKTLKRGRPKKAAAMVPATTASLTRTTRKIARSRAATRARPVPVASRSTVLNRLVNISVVAAVFVTALAIQRIVPTEPVATPRAESLPTQASAPAAIPEGLPATSAAPETPPTPATPNEAVPASVKKIPARVAKKSKPELPALHRTTLNDGGTEDLDSEAARQSYLAKSRLATRAANSNK